MKLADSSHQRLEAFFREHLNDADFRLPAINFYVGIFTKILTNLISVHGITFGKRIFIAPKHLSLNQNNFGITFGKRIFIAPKHLSLNQNNFLKLPEDLIAHEITHTLQYRREGFVKFFYKYLLSYRRNLCAKKKWNAAARQEAYLEIPFEIEARATAARFVEWNSFQDKRRKAKVKSHPAKL